MKPITMLYELMYIVSASVADDDVGKVEATVKALLEKYGATIKETKRLGKFRFAYPIKNLRHGHYILVNLEAEPTTVAKLDEALRISNDVVRHLILRADEAGEGSFELVQFTEVNLDAKEDRPRRKREDAPTEDKAKAAEEIKSGAAALDAKPSEEKVAVAMTDEELEKKLAAALTSDAKEA